MGRSSHSGKDIVVEGRTISRWKDQSRDKQNNRRVKTYTADSLGLWVLPQRRSCYNSCYNPNIISYKSYSWRHAHVRHPVCSLCIRPSGQYSNGIILIINKRTYRYYLFSNQIIISLRSSIKTKRNGTPRGCINFLVLKQH